MSPPARDCPLGAALPALRKVWLREPRPAEEGGRGRLTADAPAQRPCLPPSLPPPGAPASLRPAGGSLYRRRAAPCGGLCAQLILGKKPRAQVLQKHRETGQQLFPSTATRRGLGPPSSDSAGGTAAAPASPGVPVGSDRGRPELPKSGVHPPCRPDGVSGPGRGLVALLSSGPRRRRCAAREAGRGQLPQNSGWTSGRGPWWRRRSAPQERSGEHLLGGEEFPTQRGGTGPGGGVALGSPWAVRVDRGLWSCGRHREEGRVTRPHWRRCLWPRPAAEDAGGW